MTDEPEVEGLPLPEDEHVEVYRGVTLRFSHGLIEEMKTNLNIDVLAEAKLGVDKAIAEEEAYAENESKDT